MSEPQHQPPNVATVVIRLVLVGVIITAGVLAAKHFIDTKKKPQRKPPGEMVRLVTVMTVEPSSATVGLPAMGVVTPAEEGELTSQVEGKLLWVSPSMVDGGLLAKGAIAARVDPADYELLIAQRQSDLSRAEGELKSEQGQQRIARREYEMLKGSVTAEDRELILREPQLRQARDAVASAKARLDKVKLDIQRTTIRCEFNAEVRSETVAVGTLVRNGISLATLVSTDVYWVLLSVPVDELRFISVPGFNASAGKGSSVRIEYEAGWGKGKFRTGTVTRLLSELEPQGRMARLVVSVDDPRSLKPENANKPHLLLGAYVRATITGVMMPYVARLPRRVVREGNTVWLVRDDKTLAIAKIKPIFKTRDEIWVVARGGSYTISSEEWGYWVPNGSTPQRIVVTDLSTPVEGMKLRIEGDPVTPVKTAPAPKPTKPVQGA